MNLTLRILARLAAPFRNPRPVELAAPAGEPLAADDVYSFWREAGRQWAEAQASTPDLDFIAALEKRTATLDRESRANEIVGVLQDVWRDGFSPASEGFAWDGMPVEIPAWALVAFVEGASSARQETGLSP